MNSLRHTSELLSVARRVVWFKAPADALDDPVHFLAHAMTYGAIDDLRILQRSIDPAMLIEALKHAPPGVFDRRSWAYWNIKMGRVPIPPMPVRQGLCGTENAP